MFRLSCTVMTLALSVLAWSASAATPSAAAGPATAPATNASDQRVARTYALPASAGGGTIALGVPAGWKDLTGPPEERPDAPPTTIHFEATDAVGKFECEILAVRPPDPAAVTPDDLKQQVRRLSQEFLATSVEREVRFQDWNGLAGEGFLASFTDGSADFGTYKCVTVGAMRVGPVVLLVNVFHQERSPAQKLALDMIAGARVDRAAGTK